MCPTFMLHQPLRHTSDHAEHLHMMFIIRYALFHSARHNQTALALKKKPSKKSNFRLLNGGGGFVPQKTEKDVIRDPQLWKETLNP